MSIVSNSFPKRKKKGCVVQGLIASLFPAVSDVGVEAMGSEECLEECVVWCLCFTSPGVAGPGPS